MRYSTPTRLTTLMLALLLAALAVPAAAAMADGKDVLRDCAQDGDLDKDYSDEELEEANRNMPTDIDEYSDCRDVIRQAQAGGKGSADGTDDTGSLGGSGSGGSGGNLTGEDTDGAGGTASDQQELLNRADAARNGSEPDGGIAADTAASGTTDSDSGLPTAGLVAIILLMLAGLAGSLYALRDRLPASIASRIPGLGPGAGR